MTKHNYQLIVFLFCITFSNFLYSQIQIAVDMDEVRYIQHEGIDITLHVINDSGSQLTFGNNGGKIEFLILSEVNDFSTKINSFQKSFNPAKGLLLAAGETKKMTIRLNKYFPLSKAVRYRIKARISHPRLQNAVETRKYLDFEVSAGDLLRTRDFGLSDVRDPQKILTRSYSIVGFNEKRSSSYCLKIHDSKWVYALHRLGPKVRGVPLQDDVDSFSNIHILIQLQPKIFSHSIFSPDGKKQQEIIYRASFDNVPRLDRDPDLGKISVRDGLKATEGIDYIRQGNQIKILNN
jgi:hypothetical protein